MSISLIEKNILKEIDYWCSTLNFQYNIEDTVCYVSSSDFLNHWKFNITNNKNIILYHRDRDNKKVHYHKQKVCNNIKHLFLYIKRHDSKYIQLSKNRRQPEKWDIFLKLKN